MKKQKLRHSIGQSVTEYAILLALVAAALIAMQVYLKRGIQGRVKDLADQISPEQYESGRTESEYVTTQSGRIVQGYSNGESRLRQDELTIRGGDEVVRSDTQ